MALGEALGKFEWEVLAISQPEFARWLAYFKINEENKPKPTSE